MNRLISLTTHYGESLKFLALTGEDQLSTLFEYRVHAVSQGPIEDQKALLGTEATVSMDAGDERSGAYLRYLHGMVTEVRLLSQKRQDSANYYHYELVLRPRLWYSTKNGRIFQDMR